MLGTGNTEMIKRRSRKTRELIIGERSKICDRGRNGQDDREEGRETSRTGAQGSLLTTQPMAASLEV